MDGFVKVLSSSCKHLNISNMAIKKNESTINRPDGDRIIDAPYVFIDFDNFINQLKNEDAWEKNDRNGITVFKTDNVTTVLVCLHANAVFRKNVIDGIFTLQVIDGKVKVTTPDSEIDMQANQMIVFHHLIDHSVIARTDSVLLLTNQCIDN